MKKRRNSIPFYIAFAITIGFLAGLQALFHFEVPAKADVSSPEPIIPEPQNNTVINEGTQDSPDDLQDTPSISVVPNSAVRSSSVWSYTECFSDSQATQLSAAILNGITPPQSRDELTTLLRRHQLVDITHSPFYTIDSLHHSMPYLVPKAQQLLTTIAINFIDSLHHKGLHPHRPIVTSVLRTADDVSRLQQGNKNATTNSCHSYGTTIDITYQRFSPLDQPDRTTRYDDQLKLVLAEVLYDLRTQGRCYVKYESKQACFHLTVR